MGTVITNAKNSYLYCDLFRPNRKPVTAMIVCVCRRVSDREIARHAKAGMSFEDIQFELGVATQCGQCECFARDVVAQCCGSHPSAALHCETAAVNGAAAGGEPAATATLP